MASSGLRVAQKSAGSSCQDVGPVQHSSQQRLAIPARSSPEDSRSRLNLSMKVCTSLLSAQGDRSLLDAGRASRPDRRRAEGSHSAIHAIASARSREAGYDARGLRADYGSTPRAARRCARDIDRRTENGRIARQSPSSCASARGWPAPSAVSSTRSARMDTSELDRFSSLYRLLKYAAAEWFGTRGSCGRSSKRWRRGRTPSRGRMSAT